MSRRIALIEAIVIAAPVTALYFFFGPFVLLAPVLDAATPTGVLIVSLALLAYGGIVAGWALLLAYIRRGICGLRKRAIGWWIVARCGLVLLAVGVAANYSLMPEFSAWWWTRMQLSIFAFGAPLALPMLHLELERRFRVE